MNDNMKAVRIGDDWDSFLNEHPDLRVVKDGENIVSVEFPPDAENSTLIILEGEVYILQYSSTKYQCIQNFQSPKAKKSQLYKIISTLL